MVCALCQVGCLSFHASSSFDHSIQRTLKFILRKSNARIIPSNFDTDAITTPKSWTLQFWTFIDWNALLCTVQSTIHESLIYVPILSTFVCRSVKCNSKLYLVLDFRFFSDRCTCGRRVAKKNRDKLSKCSFNTHELFSRIVRWLNDAIGKKHDDCLEQIFIRRSMYLSLGPRINALICLVIDLTL